MISTRGRYALRLMIDLAEHSDEGFIPLKDIAKRQDISKKYLEQIIPLLNDQYKIVQATANELNEYLGASYLNILNSVVTSQKVNINLYIALAVVFFLFFGCAGAIVIGRLKDFI